MDIRILPSNIANMIAAGEVVQRPASVVKELMENAVDAGADQVTVVIQDAGRTLIQVIDNGCGMSPDQAVLCFERHATSKLASAEDLHNILTFGFRGEALASIAAVAEVTLKTRREEDEIGCQVEFADSQHLATDEVATARGANFSVRNLFYNVPARRKFLKSDNVEFKHIVSEFTRVALTRPQVGFTLTHNGKDVFVLRPAFAQFTRQTTEYEPWNDGGAARHKYPLQEWHRKGRTGPLPKCAGRAIGPYAGAVQQMHRTVTSNCGALSSRVPPFFTV